jgi:glycosyltransferase involved in cell wall biosynthesis
MISYIIIGRNEGWKLTKCLHSIFETIAYNNLEEAEVIYVDSKSNDDSIVRAKAFEKVKIFQITGECNAAIARNIGAKEAKGNILVFVDADMEVLPNFFKQVILSDTTLRHPFITGHIKDYLYDKDDSFLGTNNRTFKKELPNRIENIDTCGGIFLLERETWEKISGMNTKYTRSQDLDFSLRLKKENIALIRYPIIIVKHHTIDYNNHNRMWRNLRNGYHLYPPLLYRDHFFEFPMIKRALRVNYSSIILMAAGLLSLFMKTPIFFVGYFFVLFLKIFKNTVDVNINKNKFVYFIERILFQINVDLLFWVGIVLFHPARKKEAYIKIANP